MCVFSKDTSVLLTVFIIYTDGSNGSYIIQFRNITVVLTCLKLRLKILHNLKFCLCIFESVLI